MRLIDVDELMKAINEGVIFTVSAGRPNAEIRGANKVISVINQCPTIEAEPVKCGRWVMLKYPLVECSACKEMRDCAHQFGWNYCPNCGAKMESEVEQ